MRGRMRGINHEGLVYKLGTPLLPLSLWRHTRLPMMPLAGDLDSRAAGWLVLMLRMLMQRSHATRLRWSSSCGNNHFINFPHCLWWRQFVNSYQRKQFSYITVKYRLEIIFIHIAGSSAPALWCARDCESEDVSRLRTLSLVIHVCRHIKKNCTSIWSPAREERETFLFNYLTAV